MKEQLQVQQTTDKWETTVQELNNAQVTSFASSIAQIYFAVALANWGAVVSSCFQLVLGL